MTEKTIWQKLADPFPPSAISWRVGSTNGEKTKGLALAYIDARDVMRRLDDVLGAANWSDSYAETPKGRIICTIAILHGGSWVSKSDAAGDTDVEGEKGAISDAFKRAAVKWGIGRYLYDLDSPWVELAAAGRSYKIKDSEYTRLEKLLGGKFRVAPEPPAAPQAPKQEIAAAAVFSPAMVMVPRLGENANADFDWIAWGKAVIAQVKAAPDADGLALLVRNNAAPMSNAKTQSSKIAARVQQEIDGRFPTATA